MSDLKSYIKDIPNFPKEGIVFRDITSLLQNPDGYKTAIDEISSVLEDIEFDSVIGLDARGFLFASPIAYKTGKALIPIRKKGKLPRGTVSVEYELEYGKAEVEIHKDAVHPRERVVIIDDLLATGGTLEAAAKLVEKLGGKVVKIITLIELADLDGRCRLKEYDYESIVKY